MAIISATNSCSQCTNVACSPTCQHSNVACTSMRQRLLPAYKLASRVNASTCFPCQSARVPAFSSFAKRIHAENVMGRHWDVLKIRYKIFSKLTSQVSPNYVPLRTSPRDAFRTSAGRFPIIREKMQKLSLFVFPSYSM